MKCLLDTPIWLWSLTTSERLNDKARDLLSSGEDEFYLSAASSWEIVIKTAHGQAAAAGAGGQLYPKAAGHARHSTALDHPHPRLGGFWSSFAS
jgi:PIN domain nuclease of toxin-antitoxin system